VGVPNRHLRPPSVVFPFTPKCILSSAPAVFHAGHDHQHGALMSDDLDKLVAGITPENVHPEYVSDRVFDGTRPLLKKPEIKRDPEGDLKDTARA